MKALIQLVLITLITATAHANEKYEGMVCDGEQDERQLVKISSTESGPLLVVYRGGHELSSAMAVMIVTEDIQIGIEAGDATLLDNKSAEYEGSTVEFKKRGMDYQGKPRVSIKLSQNGEAYNLTSCSPWKPARVSIY